MKLTLETRQEMQKYKQMAQYIEQKLIEEKKITNTDVVDTVMLNTSCDTFNLSSLESCSPDRDDDERQNQNESLGSETDYLKVSSIMLEKKQRNPTNIYQKLDITPIQRKRLSTDDFTDKSIVPMMSSMDINLDQIDTTFNVMSQSVPCTSAQTSSDIPPPPSNLVRSNSYTMLAPSPILLRHLEAQGVIYNQKKWRPTVSMEELNRVEDYRQPPTNVEPKIAITSAKKGGGVKKSTSTNWLATLRKKSPYDVKIATKPTTCKSKASTTQKLQSRETKLCRAKAVVQEPPPPDIDVMVARIEEEHRTEIFQLMRRQQEEQARMEENFNRQQVLLLQKIEESMNIRKSLNHEPPPPSSDLGRLRIIGDHVNDDKKNNNHMVVNGSIETAIRPVSKCLLEQYLEQAKLPTPPKNQQPSANRQRDLSIRNNNAVDPTTPQSCSRRRLFPPSIKLMENSESSLNERVSKIPFY